MIEYTEKLDFLTPSSLEGFFQGWTYSPSPQQHIKILKNADYVVLAIDNQLNNKVIGFVYAISDHTLSAYIPLIEVIESYRGKGVGKELMKRILNKLNRFYMVDVCCDEEICKF